ncbi:DNA mismatch repair endonuclease MutL [Rubinisphaera margarita]|uniref:DNA mismatch repair endonuclease MutL n=1 Tax=Rubinisphaera margarita TaxID=2909586 RepID=UPI001EE949D6|nr:DNA mismatch repair endonuclease MutL [Rubinisphaera margarita]MCG6154716.1 DNA mismatch repair endonuclease MutL [Rubinisphaera margarita]
MQIGDANSMGRTSHIQVLSPEVINKIAAGEVIERPASVIKELLENSVDALSSRIDLDIEEGGTELIRIADDGEGIPADELPLAVTSHATSKLRQADDLFCVQTMGFRGEALASIAEVSHFKIRSRVHEENVGAEMAVICGDRSEIRPTGCAPGTQIEIRQLFCNTPVRRKFLKKSATEFGYISEQFTRVALASPRLQLSLTHNGKNVYRLPANQELKERLILFHGSQTVDKLIPVEAEHNGIRLWGYVGHPSLNKSTRKSQYLFLNGRYIQDRSLQHALGEAYRGLLMTGRFPVAFLFLEMPSDQVDVNVHPTKSEVRFRDQQFLFRLLLSTLRTKFLQSDLQSQLNIRPAGAPAAPDLRSRQQKVEQDLVSWARNQLEHQVQRQPAPTETPTNPLIEPLSAHSGVVTETPTTPATDERPLEQAAEILAEATGGQPGLPTTVPESQEAIATPTSTATQLPPISSIQALQVDDCYIVLSTDQGLTVIDQHALHERVLYERFRKKVLDGKVEVQKLLMPVTMDMDEKKMSLLLDHADLLREIGFSVESFGRGMLAVDSHPVFLGHNDIRDVMTEFAEKFEDSSTVGRRELLDETLHMMACKAAIKAGQRLTADEIVALLAQREMIDDAHHCPHGRPTALVLSREDLDRQFGRLGA